MTNGLFFVLKRRRRPPGFIHEFFRLAGPFWRSWPPLVLIGGLTALTIGQVYLSIRINLWSKDLFDSLEQKSFDRFIILIGMLVIILTGLIVVNATHLLAKRSLQLRWRQWLTRIILGNWMADGRHYQINYISGEHDNPDARIAEDIRIATEVALELAHSLLYCILLLIGFTQILWAVSGWLNLQIAGATISIPGHMVWIALLYASAGSALAFLLGVPLTRAADHRQTAEADFRSTLMRARENSEAIALLHGESDERHRLIDAFRNIRDVWFRQTIALSRILAFSSGYSVLSTVFPLLVTAPRYLAGAITLGVLVQTAQAFLQMVQALSWPVDNLPRVAEWRASVERVLSLQAALMDVRARADLPNHEGIRVTREDARHLVFRDLSIYGPNGEILLGEFNATIEPGERILISGDPAAAIHLFKVVAGLWPWGKGAVELPKDEDIFFMPRRPYLSYGRLREAVAYSVSPHSFEETELGAALKRVGLEHLISRLNESGTWERDLTAGEQQRLGFARLLLQRPKWIFIEEATDALDPDGEDEMMQLLLDEFPQAAILTISYHAAVEAYHDRRLSFERATNGRFPWGDDGLHGRRRKSRGAKSQS